VALAASTPEWPGDTPFSCQWTWDMTRGDSVNVSSVSGSPHVGTHADAPFHVGTGWATADAMPLDPFAGPSTVVDVAGRTGPLTLESLGVGARGVAGGRLLVRTGQSIADGAFPPGWPWLAEQAVSELLAGGLRLLGVDAPSVDGRESRSLEVHRALFSGGAYVLENLDLRHVTAGNYELSAFPMKMAGLDAAPVRAVLRKLDRA
jgi:arylformamidase